MQSDRERTLESRMDDYLTKPIDLQKLSAAIDRWALPLKCAEPVRAF